MPKARILDGRETAAALHAALAVQTTNIKRDHGLTPGIAMILVGKDAASHIYVRNKTRLANEVGFHVLDILLPEDTEESEILEQVATLNADATIHGFLVQLPLPPKINPERVIDAIDPTKDADGFHAVNAGRLAMGRAGVVPATPMGCLHLIHQARSKLEGLEAVVIGRSNTVGKPLAQLLLREHCTVTLAHSRTGNLAEVARRADILVAAVGCAELIRGDWIKPGATVIDVGINRINDLAGGKPKIVGDVAFTEAQEVAGAVTPVPGGVGPMTIVYLLQNTLALACKKIHVDVPV